jgi:hypothetical protein
MLKTKLSASKHMISNVKILAFKITLLKRSKVKIWQVFSQLEIACSLFVLAI